MEWTQLPNISLIKNIYFPRRYRNWVPISSSNTPWKSDGSLSNNKIKQQNTNKKTLSHVAMLVPFIDIDTNTTTYMTCIYRVELMHGKEYQIASFQWIISRCTFTWLEWSLAISLFSVRRSWIYLLYPSYTAVTFSSSWDFLLYSSLLLYLWIDIDNYHFL